MKAAEGLVDATRRAEELAGFATWTYDPRTGDLNASPYVRTLLDLPRDAPLQSMVPWFEVVHPDDKPDLFRAWQALLRDGTEYVLEHRIVVGGCIKHMRAVACRTTSGLLHGITQDVTAARAAAADLQRQRDVSLTVLHGLHEAVLLVRDEIIVQVNEAACDLTGFGATELVGSSPPYPFWPSQDADGTPGRHEQLFSSSGGSASVALTRRDGTRLTARCTTTRLALDGSADAWVVTARDVTHEDEQARRLRAQAETDPLTGIPNSRAFRAHFVQAVRASEETGEPVSLALLDIDHFKRINDEHGHATGDEVLREVAQRMQRTVADLGLLFRVGGEEFALLMNHLAAPQAHATVRRALATLRAAPILGVGVVTASAGVAQHVPPMSADALYRLADSYLYEAKARGRDQVR